jgi:ABC-type uncharacterized transport system substrate-binding protein
MMRRRQFITLLGDAAAAWPLAARAQQTAMHRVGVLMPGTENDQEEQSRLTAFQQSLAKAGWTNGHNVQIDYRWGALDNDRTRAFAIELVGLRPDVLFAGNTTTVAALQRATRSIPIVFALVADPIGGGFVVSLARPGGNITGIMATEAPRFYQASSRADHRCGGPAPLTCDLPRPLIHHKWRPDFLWGEQPNSIYRDAAFYVDRILRGAKPGDLPVQRPTKYELVINIKTAKELGLSLSHEFLLTADEVIE